jgi:hypothetical protein
MDVVRGYELMTYLRQILTVVLLVFCLATGAEAVGLQIHTAGTLAKFVSKSTATETIGEIGIGTQAWSANYSFRTSFSAVHTGTISTAVFTPLGTGNFTLLIYNSSGTLLRTSNTVAVTATGSQAVSFPPVVINAGEFLGGHHTGDVNCTTSAGGTAWYGGPGAPTNATIPYVVRFDLQATIDY